MGGQISQMLVEAGNYSAKVPLQVSRNEKEKILRISYLSLEVYDIYCRMITKR